METTLNDVSFFKHDREVVHKDGSRTNQLAPVKKTVHSLKVIEELMGASNRRYLEFLSTLTDDSCARQGSGEKITKRKQEEGRTFRGFNFLGAEDAELFRVLSRGEWTISGFTNRALRGCLPGKTSAQVARMLKGLRVHGLIKKIGHRFKYYLTALGRRVVSAALQIREHVAIAALTNTPEVEK